jgi:hypothetical protein
LCGLKALVFGLVELHHTLLRIPEHPARAAVGRMAWLTHRADCDRTGKIGRDLNSASDRLAFRLFRIVGVLAVFVVEFHLALAV